MNNWLEQTGWYGKLPGNGDFISHNLSLTNFRFFQRQLDQIMTQVQTNTQRISNYYNSFPVGFLYSSQSAGNVQGFLLPSVDRVGRAYPWLVLSQNTETCCTHWHHFVKHLSISALDQNWTGATFQENFEQNLKNLGTMHLQNTPLKPSNWFDQPQQSNLFQWFKDNGQQPRFKAINCTAEHCDWGQLFDD